MENRVDHVFSNATDYVNDIRKLTRGVDLIVENEAVGDFSYLRSLLNPLGMIIAIGANNVVDDKKKLSMFDFFKLWWSQESLSLQEFMMYNRGVSGLHLGLLAEQNPVLMRKNFKKICRLLQLNKIKSHIDSEYEMENIVDATRKLGERKNIGKIVLKIQNRKNKK